MLSVDPAEREQRLDEILASYLRAAESGDAPNPDALVACNPDLAPELEAFFANERKIDRLASPLRSIHRAAAPPASGEVLGNHEILEEIAHGGMGVVYRARQRNLNRLVALKMLRAGPLAGPAERQRFRAEAEAFAHLDHPGIVPIFEVGEQDERFYFTMRLMEGGSLAQSVARFRGKPRDAARLLVQVAEAVHYAHQRGFLHRDLKPANILLDAHGRPHVSDFGLAKRLAGAGDGSIDPTQTGAILGTPSYMAPEQASGTRDSVTTAADVYSLGAILYELLTGRPPFRGETPLATLVMAKEQEPRPPSALCPGLDRDIETICLKCLEKQPGRRYASAGELADELRRYAEGKAIVARPVRGLEAFTRWCRRRPLVAAFAALFVVAFVLVTWQWARAELHAQRADANARQSERNAALADEHAADARAHAARAEENAKIARANAERAEANAAAEKVARERQERYFARAHEAVNKFSNIFSERDLLNVPGMQDVRKGLLEDSLVYYQDFLKEHQGDPQLERELADAQVRVARIRSAVGSRTDALTAYLDARKAYEKFLAAAPNDRELRHKLASTELNTGVVQMALGQVKESMEDYARARGHYRALIKDDADDRRAIDGLAICLSNEAQRYLKTGRTAEARTALDEARKLRELLVAKHPQNNDYRNHLAGVYNSIGILQGQERRPVSETRELYRKMLELREDLVARNPQVPIFQRDLAEAHHNLGVIEDRLRNTRVGRDHFQKAHDLHERLVRENPKVTQYQRDLAGSQVDLGLAHLFAGEHAQGFDWFQKARAQQERLVKEHPQVAGHRKDLARTWFQIGVACERLERRDEAIAAYRRSRDLNEQLIREDAESLDNHDRLAQTLNNLGLTLAEGGKFDEGRAALLQAIEQERIVQSRLPSKSKTGSATMGNYFSTLAEVERRAGKLEASLAAAQEQRKLAAGHGEQLFRAAGNFARLVPLTTVAADADRYALLAVDTLREARATNMKDFTARLRTSKELDPLRVRADFQALATVKD